MCKVNIRKLHRIQDVKRILLLKMFVKTLENYKKYYHVTTANGLVVSCILKEFL